MDEIFINIAGIAALIISVILHEVAHAWTALKCGDTTARDAGRITLNPLPHIDPVGTLLVPGLLLLSGSGFFFAWAKPVPINIRRCRDPRFAYWATAVAGPLANLAQAAAATLGMWLCLRHWGVSAVYGMPFSILMTYGLTNMVLMAFNLIPIPPLDGSRVVTVLLPSGLAWRYAQLERVGFILVVVLMQSSFFQSFLRTVQNGYISLVQEFVI